LLVDIIVQQGGKAYPLLLSYTLPFVSALMFSRNWFFLENIFWKTISFSGVW